MKPPLKKQWRQAASLTPADMKKYAVCKTSWQRKDNIIYTLVAHRSVEIIIMLWLILIFWSKALAMTSIVMLESCAWVSSAKKKYTPKKNTQTPWTFTRGRKYFPQDLGPRKPRIRGMAQWAWSMPSVIMTRTGWGTFRCNSLGRVESDKGVLSLKLIVKADVNVKCKF